MSVQSSAKPKEVISVKTGFTAEAAPKSEAPPSIIEATKEDLLTLQGESAVQLTKAETDALSPEMKKNIDGLSEKTKEAVLNDIKTENEDLYKELSANKTMSTDEINTAVVAGLYKMAPSNKKKKPTQSEIDSIGKDVYEKYFDSKKLSK